MKRFVLCLALMFLPCWTSAAVPEGSAEERLAAGVRQVEEGDFEVAVPTLEAVVKRTSAAPGQSKVLTRAYLYLAIAYLGLSQEADAKARFLDAILHDRNLSLSPREFSPKIIHSFEQAKREAEADGSPSPPAPKNSQAFFVTVKVGDFQRVREALEADSSLLNARDAAYGATALHWAALKGHEAMVGLLVSAGADLRATNADGETPLEVAARGRRRAVVELLKPPGAHEFFEAAKVGDVAAVRSLLETNPTLITEADLTFGATGLHWAALRGQAALVSFLIAAGADPRARNRDGETPLQVARRARKEGVVEILRPRSAP